MYQEIENRINIISCGEKYMGLTNKEMKWDKLDNTAILFPAVANESMTSVYRVSITLTEKIIPEKLQEALEKVLPLFDIFHARMRRGFFWYYFEDNMRPAPRVRLEENYPCQYIPSYQNNGYLFRVTYFENRINLEVFHVVTDGMGAVNFLRELVYKYLRLTHEDLMKALPDELCSETSLNKEDSYLKNYTGKKFKKKYKTERAIELTGEFLPPKTLSVMHGYMRVDELKMTAKKYGVSINTYLVAVYTYAIYREYLHGAPNKKPISICVPVNLRPFYESITTKNFFAMTAAVFRAENQKYTLEEIIRIVDESLKEQITRENLDSLISYNVSNQKNMMLRVVPLFIKRIGVKWVYRASALANTSTVTNIGNLKISEPYRPYVAGYSAVLSMTKGQNMKCSISSYQNQLVYTISSKMTDHSVQKRFFQTLSKEGISVTVETNGE